MVTHDFVDTVGIFDSDSLVDGLCGLLLGEPFHPRVCAR
jgi:hypothetical protein